MDDIDLMTRIKPGALRDITSKHNTFRCFLVFYLTASPVTAGGYPDAVLVAGGEAVTRVLPVRPLKHILTPCNTKHSVISFRTSGSPQEACMGKTAASVLLKLFINCYHTAWLFVCSILHHFQQNSYHSHISHRSFCH